MNRSFLRVKFVGLWLALCVVKLVLAWRLPLFVDEAFYVWEGRHSAWAYSDLPGLTAWLTRLGAGLAGDSPLAVRLPFLLLGAALPWIVVRLSSRWYGETAGWTAGLLAMLMPLSGLLGVMALPDVPVIVAALLCLDAIASSRERPSFVGWLQLTLALVIGALAHYRFSLVVVAGLAGVIADEKSRALLRRPGLWIALAVGALAWLPLLLWNAGHADAGWRFQVVDRNPWSFHWDGLWWVPIQALMVTPVLFALLLATYRALARDSTMGDARRLPFAVASISVAGYFLLGFFADRERVSFHWPLAGWLVLVLAAPVVLRRWRAASRVALFMVTAVGLLIGIAYLGIAASPPARAALSDSRAYPAGFAGWTDIVARLRADPAPAGTRLVADNFELAAQLAVAFPRDDIRVLDHALNRKHGRSVQLQIWDVLFEPARRSNDTPLWLVVDDSATPMKFRLKHYHTLCEDFGWLPRPEVLLADRGRKRFLIFRFPHGANSAADEPCAAPALAWIDEPQPGANVGSQFSVSGWAFKDGPGLARVDITLDDRVVATANYGRAMPNVAEYWRISNDPAQPRVGFQARLDLSGVAPGKHRLGLVLHGADGSLEPWASQAIVVERR